MLFRPTLLPVVLCLLNGLTTYSFQLYGKGDFEFRGLSSENLVRREIQSRATFPGFQLVSTQSLAGLGLSSTCEQVLYQPLACDNFTALLGDKTYHGSLGDAVLTASVCDASCSTALAAFHRRVNGACAATPELSPGFPVLALIDSIWGGWNETCVKDNSTAGGFCNGKYSSTNSAFRRYSNSTILQISLIHGQVWMTYRLCQNLNCVRSATLRNSQQ